MKTRYTFFRHVSVSLFLILALTAGILAQPQYYNYNTATNSNAFPFSVVAGKVIQWIILPGQFNQPTPAPSGNITKIHFFLATATITFTNLTVKMGTTTDVTLPTGVFYTGQLDTVYFNPSVTLTSTAGTFTGITLDVPYNYDNTKSLVIEVNQCGATATGMSSYSTAMTGTIRRTFNQTAGGCNYIYQSQGNTVINCGIDVAPAVLDCSYSWSIQASGSTAQFNSVKAVSNLVGWAAGVGAVVRRTTDGGSTWVDGNSNPGVIVGDIYNIEAISENTAWVTTTPDTTYIYKTTNGGTNWVRVFTQPGGFINGMRMISPTNGYAFGDPVALVWTVLATTDGGTTWVQLPTAPASVTGEDGRNNSFQVSLPDIWYTTGQSKVYHSTNAGLNWTNSPATGITGQVTGVQFNTSAVGLIAGTTMSKTTDGGTTFTLLPAIGSGLIRGIKGSGNSYWYVRDSSVYFSTDVGASWIKQHQQTRIQNDISLVAGPNGCLTGWSAGVNGTISKMTGAVVGISDPVSQIPKTYLLEQNYPNPFNPVTNITFALPVSGNVELKIYDILGREVAELINTFVNAGTHTVPFDASTLASGIYIYKINTGSFTDSKKMVLIK